MATKPNLSTLNPFGYQRRDARDVGRRVGPITPNPEIIKPPVISTPFPMQPLPAVSPVATLDHQAHVRWQNYASLMCGGNLPITGVGATILGVDLDVANRYQVAYKNTLGRVTAVKVVGDFGVSTGSANLSFSTELSNQNLVDQLSASGTVVTGNILLAPEQILYIKNADPTLLITLAGAVFRVLLLDPASVFGEKILP